MITPPHQIMPLRDPDYAGIRVTRYMVPIVLALLTMLACSIVVLSASTQIDIYAKSIKIIPSTCPEAGYQCLDIIFPEADTSGNNVPRIKIGNSALIKTSIDGSYKHIMLNAQVIHKTESNLIQDLPSSILKVQLSDPLPLNKDGSKANTSIALIIVDQMSALDIATTWTRNKL